MHAVAPANGSVREPMYLLERETLAVERPGNGPPALRAQVERQICLPSDAHEFSYPLA